MTLVVVTGAGSGIGRATAQRFARKGAVVIVSDINETTGNESVDLIRSKGGNAVFRRLDVADVEDWEAFTGWVVAEFGVPDVVVNNAGILIGGGFLEQTGDDWRRMIQINMMSPLIGSRLFVEKMVRAGTRGHIVNVASMGAFLPTAVGPSYVTAKAGVWLGTQALRSEFGPQGIGVSAICPGLIRTRLAANGTRGGVSSDDSAAWAAKLAAGHRFMGRSPKRVAAAVERAVRFNLATVPVGLEAWLGWYLYRLSPAAMRGISSAVSMSLADKAVGLSGKVFGGVK
ncbi:SDR family NAD(P)-dependent oxidoreductase [Mycobacteroides chelonae]|uniref:Oxidoreductase n=1 Tax=Mycobacteroides chelonae TaxID=1774 RepID=A0A1S1M5Q2_MYCCH|nr:SDR family NAD(P)-dependent oxidoreductase [Mycobacteroides chelonae]OHU53260.1 oxidoreductase [Mycobacteroides chelonae]OHU78178.1 oxidoreductase [Mycobacteroides chelonae]QQG86638.1 SDR family NAD(P)-dependent oxidoreductase [Mycobacteroides chelonae]QQG91455.1 SDR family NAD(P)-dependent oxidoreductase [Mycobacteroides chelonae]